MSQTLYALTDQYRFLLEALANEDSGELDPEHLGELSAKLSDTTIDLGEKAENIGKYILSLEADVAAIRTEEERLASRKKSIENKASWLKDYLLREMMTAGIPKIKRELFTVSIRNNPPSVNVIDVEQLPNDFRRIIPETWQPDKKAILEHFKGSGEILPGVEMVVDKKRLEIK